MARPLPILNNPLGAPGAPDPAPTPQQCEAMAVVFKALGDPVRLRLFACIASSTDSLCVCHIPDVGVSQPTVSHHLRKLREAGLIDCERRGTWVHYWPTTQGRGVYAIVVSPPS